MRKDDKMKTGDMVIVIESPYSDVPKGTRGTIKKIYPHHFSRNEPLFELWKMSTGDHRLFRQHELILYPNES